MTPDEDVRKYEKDHQTLMSCIEAAGRVSEVTRLDWKRTAQNITATYKLFDQYPEGFFCSVPDIQAKFLVRLHSTHNSAL